MKKIVSRLLFVSTVLAMMFVCQSKALAQTGSMAFKNGKFKIVQLTDIHLTGDSRSAHVPGMITAILQKEAPDLVVVTGDVIFAADEAKLWKEFGEFISSANIPYVVTLGNHDSERAYSRKQAHEIVGNLPGCVNNKYLAIGSSDFVIPVMNSKGRVGTALYVFDSNDYNADDRSYKGVTTEQVAWYKATGDALAKENKGKVNSLAFMHVPLMEYKQAFDSGDFKPVGYRLEDECPGRDNSGMFEAMVAQKDVTGVFVGHDHSNNYVASLRGIALCYGRYSGSYGVYQELISGARVIELSEDKPGFATWQRLVNGNKTQQCEIPMAKNVKK